MLPNSTIPRRNHTAEREGKGRRGYNDQGDELNVGDTFKLTAIFRKQHFRVLAKTDEPGYRYTCEDMNQVGDQMRTTIYFSDRNLQCYDERGEMEITSQKGVEIATTATAEAVMGW